jgi:hypothetical protein
MEKGICDDSSCQCLEYQYGPMKRRAHRRFRIEGKVGLGIDRSNRNSSNVYWSTRTIDTLGKATDPLGRGNLWIQWKG